MGKIIAVAIPKGGVGKTTTAVNLAFAFALRKKKTLLIELDASGVLVSALGYPKSEIVGNMFHVLSYVRSLPQVIHKTENDFLDIIPFENLSAQDEVRLSKLTQNEYVLRNIIQSQAGEYEYIFLDCPPSLIGLTTGALVAADSVIIPVRASKFSLNAVDRIVKNIEVIKKQYNYNLSIEGILLTMYESNTNVSTEAESDLIKKYPDSLFHIKIPKNVAVTNSFYKSKPVITDNPSAKASIAYHALANLIIQRHNNSK
ncbi:MAG: ParA family protein [Ignavibacteriae bacterium]|nr:ParA family protein [Ignavibacteriota bacterium]NOG96499.1 ParA family protein [Ignavibacteriota bacterium]